MPHAKITFHELIQDSQDYGSDDEHMVSRVFFDLEFDGEIKRGLYAHVKQPVGSSFETSPVEVSGPVNCKGPFNMQCFQQAAEPYYRGLVGSQGSGIRISGGATNIRMRNNRYRQDAVFECEFDKAGGSW
jgi:hypothetical protein